MEEKRLELHRQNYYFELDRKDKLGSNISIPLGIIILMFGAIGIFAKQATAITSRTNIIFFIVAFAILTISTIFAVIHLIKSYYGHEYEYMPKSKELEDYWEQLKIYHEKYPEVSGTAEDDFRIYLIKTYCKCNDTNVERNECKSSYLHNANTAIIIALIASLITLIPLNSDSIVAYVGKVFPNKVADKEVKENAAKKFTSISGSNSSTTTAPSNSNSKREKNTP